MTKPDLLLDGDCWVYMFAHRNQTFTTFRIDGDGPEIVTPIADLTKAKAELLSFVRDLEALLQTNDTYIALSDTGPDSNFRKRILPSYKGNRSADARPALYSHLRQFILAEPSWTAMVKPGFEGDDLLGVWLTMGDAICVSIDKDMRTCVGQHYNPDRPDEGVVTVTQDEADYTFLTQTLTGDSVDGYKGLPGCGPVAAEKVLANALNRDGTIDVAGAWVEIVKAYAKKGLTEQDALTQARMARILTTPDGDVNLWTPPSAPPTTGETND